MQLVSNSKKEKVIVGLGLTGLSCAKYLDSHGQGFKVVDSRQSPPGLAEFKKQFPQAELELGEFKLSTFLNAEELIVSPGVDLRIPVLKESIAAGVPVTGDINIFAKQVKAPIIAVTGSNAKSTVVTLLGEMAKKAGINVAVAGNIGKPVLELLEEDPCSLYVLELSSFQLETTTNLGAEVASVLNMSPDHLDRYDSMQSYHKAKHRIFQNCKQLVVNMDDALSQPLISESIKQWNFSLTSRLGMDEFSVINIAQEAFLGFNNKPLLAIKELKIKGKHNVANALAALALGHAAGIEFEPMLQALSDFSGLAHRCQWVEEKQGVNYYNDSKGTNVGACIAAIEGLGEKRKVILIAGGMGKDANFSALSKPFANFVKLLVLFGKDAKLLAQVAKDCVPVVKATNLEEAVACASNNAVDGDIVLLSPACASFDMFENYEQRGDAFVEAVRELH